MPDELPDLRASQEKWEKRAKPAPEGEKEGSSSSSDKSKKKKKAKKKKEKKKLKKEKRKSMGGRTNATKPLESLFKGTGLDPSAENRRILLRKVKKKMKKDKGSSSSSSSTGSVVSDSEVEQSMLEERSKIRRLADLAPGVLASEGLRVMKDHVLTANGTPWGVDKTSLPPIVTQYIKQQCMGKATAPMGRELLTLAAVADCLLQGRVAEGTDILFQRVKSLEQMMAGQSWMLSQKLEILPGPDVGIASRAELQAAQRERRLDDQTKAPAALGERNKGKGQGKSKEKEREKGGKGKQKSGAREDTKK